jgi:hypothetical protein
MLKRLYLLIILHMGCITRTRTIRNLLRIKFLSALRSYTFTSPYTLHNFVTEKFPMTRPYRRIYVKIKGVLRYHLPVRVPPPPNVARQRIGKHVPAATNTHST